MKHIQFILALGACLLLAVSCGLEPSPTGPEKGNIQPDKMARGETGYCNFVLHRECEEYWNNDAGVVYQLIGGVYDCSDTVLVDATPGSWGPGYEVSLLVPKNAVPTDYPGYPLVNFMVAVPVGGPADSVSSVPYHFYPDGIEFQLPVTATLRWPEWAGAYHDSNSCLINMEIEMHEEEVHYRINKRVKATPPAAKAMDPTGGEFPILHFSRWEVANGDQDSGVDPGLLLSDEVEEGEACWIPVDPPDDDGPAVLIR